MDDLFGKVSDARGSEALVGLGGKCDDRLGWQVGNAVAREDGRFGHGLPLLSIESLLVNPRKVLSPSRRHRYDDLASFRRNGESWADMSGDPH